MRRSKWFLVVMVHLILWGGFIANQFGIGPSWAVEDTENAADKIDAVDHDHGADAVTEDTVSPASKAASEKAGKSVAAVKDKTSKKDNAIQNRPKGISNEEWEKLKAKKVLPYDKGPSTVDVSKYPKEMQDIYKKDFTKRCSKCHTIARAINAPYALPEEWKRYIKKMMKKPGSGINPGAGRKIYKFLVYDSEIRKKDIIEKRLKEKDKAEKEGKK